MVFGIGERVRKMRTKKGMSQVNLSELSHIHEIGISRIECGKQQPTVETVVRLADALNCSVDYLLGRVLK